MELPPHLELGTPQAGVCMNRIFHPGDIVLVRMPGHLNFAAKVESRADSADLHHVTPLGDVALLYSARFVPWWRLDHALWTFTGYVVKPS